MIVRKGNTVVNLYVKQLTKEQLLKQDALSK